MEKLDIELKQVFKTDPSLCMAWLKGAIKKTKRINKNFGKIRHKNGRIYQDWRK